MTEKKESEGPIGAQPIPVGRAQESLARAIEPGSGLDLMSLATVFVQSGYFPDVKGVAQGVVKILAGRELGFGPVAALRHIYIHRGHIGLMATLVASKIRQSKEYDYQIKQCDDTACEIEFFRLANGQRLLEGLSAFTIEEAKRAGLLKDDSAWITYPSDLLFARAMTRGQRRYCPDVFGQTVYTPEEINALPPDSEGRVTESSEPENPYLPKRKEPVAQPAEPLKPPSAAQLKSIDALHYLMPPLVKNAAGSTEESVAREPGQSALPPAPLGGLEEAPTTLTFEIGKTLWVTSGITKEQVLESFQLEAVLKKKGINDKLVKTILRKEFQAEHRKDLTAEQGEKFLVRLRECAGQ